LIPFPALKNEDLMRELSSNDASLIIATKIQQAGMRHAMQAYRLE
jgi:hypothetical protein